MIEPEIRVTELINGYQIDWVEHNLQARVSRLRARSDGIKGELEITQRRDGTNYTLLVPTQFNFSSDRTRSMYAKQLSEKLNTSIEWREIFDYLCQEIQERVYAGEPCIEVFADENSPAPRQLLEGIIYEGVSNIIFGEKGVSKSTLAYLLAMCATLPWADNPLGLSVPDKSLRTLVLDWETDEPNFRYYLARLQKGMGLPIVPLFYRRCTLPLSDDIEAIQTHIEKSGAELLVIDSLGAAAGGERAELKGSESALLFNSALRKLKRTSLIIAQTAKRNEDRKGNTSIYGSVYFTYYARNILELKIVDEDYSDTQHLVLLHKECNLGKKMPPIGLSIEYNNGIKIEREPVNLAELNERNSVGAQILELLKEGKMKQKDIVEELDSSYSTVNTSLIRLARQKKVIKVGREWGLLEKV